MTIFFAIVLLSVVSRHSEAVKVQPHTQEQRTTSSSTQSRETADALDRLNCRRDDPMCFIRMAQSLAERDEQLDLALACVERAGAIPPVPNDAVPRSSFFLTLAYVQIKRREFDRAIDTLIRGARTAPEYSRLDQYLTYLGLAYESSGRIDEAIETYVNQAGGLRESAAPPSERLVSLYLKRFGSLNGLDEKIEANRLEARRKFFVDRNLLSIPAPDWLLNDLDGSQVSLADFSNNIVVLSFVAAGGNSNESILRFLQGLQEKHKDKSVRFVCIDLVEVPNPQLIKANLKQMGITILTLTGGSEVARQYKTLEPLIVLIDEKGMIRFKNTIWHDYQPFVTEQLKFLLQVDEK